MKITLISTLIIMLGYFLMLYGAVGFIQDKRLFSSAPKENLAVIPDRKERFKGAHIIGWVIVVFAVLLFVGAFALGIWDGARNGFGPLKYFARFLATLYGMEIYDRLVSALPLQLLPPFLPGDEGHCGATDVWLQQEGAYRTFYRVYPCLRCFGAGLCALGRQEHHEDLIPYMCEMDFISVDLMGGVLHRTGTIAAGAEMCDFYVCKKGSEWDKEIRR